MRIAITGSTGMLGTHLTERLCSLSGYSVSGLDVVPPPDGGEQGGVDFELGDVRDRSALRRCVEGADVIVHSAAALPSYPDEEITSVDVDGARAVVEVANEVGVDHIVVISSTAVYGLPKVVPTPEEYPFERVDRYNTAKIEAELIFNEARDSGVKITTLRPKTFLGPQRLGLFAMLFQWADEGRNFPLLYGGHVRAQMLDVADLVDAIMAVLELPSERTNDVFNLGARKFGSLRDDFQAVLDDAGYGRRIVNLPSWPSTSILNRLDHLGLSPVYRRLVHKLLRDSYVDTQKAADVLGFAPRYSNSDTVVRTYSWWRENRQTASVNATGNGHRQVWKQGALKFVRRAF